MMNIFNETEEERSKKAQSLFDRAMSYFHYGIYVYPVYPESTIRQEYDLYKRLKTPPIWEEVWEGKTQNEDDIRKFKWKDAVNVYAVAGKNGVRVLSIEAESERLLDTALYLLGLPFDYFWADGNYIIVECPDDCIECFNNESDGIKLIWRGYFILSITSIRGPLSKAGRAGCAVCWYQEQREDRLPYRRWDQPCRRQGPGAWPYHGTCPRWYRGWFPEPFPW